MSKARLFLRFARWHIWLGWFAAIPLLLWTISGLFMTLRPIDEVRGTDLRAEAAPIDPAGLILPSLAQPIAKLALVAQPDRPVWVVTLGNGAKQRFSGLDGLQIGQVEASEARRLADAAFAGEAPLVAVQRFTADEAPLELRQPRPSWQARFGDGTHVYIDADTGELLALRTQFWRAFDFMWGLHILDPIGRENTSHFLLWLFSAIALLSSLLGSILLFRRRRAARSV